MKYVYTLILIFITQILLGQNPYFNTIDKSQGLLTNSVYDIFQDKENYMWFATDKGLCQFNGYTFHYFSLEGMTSKAGSCIQQDAFGRIWYENFDGYLYYVENNQLHKLNQHKSIGYFKFGIIKTQLYIVNQDAIDVYDLETLHFKKKIVINTKDIRSVFFNDNRIYVFTNQLMVIENDHIQQEIPYPKDFLTHFTSILVEQTKNGLYIGSKFSNYYYTFNKGVFIRKELPLENTIIQNLSWCNEKNWLCTTTGIIEMDCETGAKKLFFKNTNISYIYKTKKNNYWIATLTDGLYFIEDFNTQLVSSQESLTAMCFKEDQLFIGTKNDKILSLQEDQLKTAYVGKDNHQMGQLFYNTYSDELFFTSSKFGILNSKLELTQELPVAVKSVCSVDSNYIAFAASSSCGIFRTNPTQNSDWDFVYDAFIRLKNTSYNNIIFNAKGKSTVYDSIHKKIYFATNNGLYFIGLNGLLSELKFKNNSLNITKLSFKNGKLYACNGDLVVFEIKNNTISEIEFPNSISKENVEKSFLKNGFLYIITNKYIFEYELVSKKLKQILHISSNIEINDILLKKHTYYISTNRGLIIKKEERHHRSTPYFAIDSIVVNNTFYKKTNWNELDYNENNIQINYRFLSTAPFEEHDLLYRVNESKWQKANILNPELVLNSLNHGKYVVEFMLNSDSKNTHKINFTIHRPFWLQLPFIIIAILSVLTFIFWLYQKNIKKIEKRNQLLLDKINLEKNVNQSKLKAIKSQMNPHFFYNALNTLQSFILSNEKKLAIDYLSKFSNLTRTILEMTEKDFVSIAEEIKTLQLYLDIEKGRFDENFKYEIQVAKNIDQENIKIPTMLLQPYVENAVKHGLLHKQGDKKVTLQFEIQNNELYISIDDNGIGRKKSNELNQIKNKKHQSFATEALQNRIDLLNEYNHKNISLKIIDKYNLQNKPIGTLVEIIIPIVNI